MTKPMRLILTTIIPALLINVSFLTASKVAFAGSADGKAVYCECIEGRDCGHYTIPTGKFGVFFEDGTVDMKYPRILGSCDRRICLGSLRQEHPEDVGYYDDLNTEILWDSKTFFKRFYRLNRETLFLTIKPYSDDYRTYYKKCEVMPPPKVLKKIEDWISNFNDEIEAEEKDARKNNKI